MAGLDPATHAVGQILPAPETHCARAHRPVMQNRVGGRDTPGHDDVMVAPHYIPRYARRTPVSARISAALPESTIRPVCRT